jgi:hypothetical protein
VSTTVVIVRPEHLDAIRKRLAEAEAVAIISESSLTAQDSILARPPANLILHAAFAASSRGATLVSGLKAGGHGRGTSVRVLIEDEDKTPLILSETNLAGARALIETSRPLIRAGTRQAVRYPMNRRPVLINGEAAELIDLSVSGAQVQVPMRVSPTHVARVMLPDEPANIRCRATVAWSIAVPSSGAIQYRAGLEFVGADRGHLASYCTRFGGAADPTLGAE